ncbi:MAG: GNAT family N-acetyltransferase [Rikenellaceae bacterium]
MIDFKPITIEDKELIESYTLRSTIRNCDLSFANMYCWQPTYHSSWAIVDGYLVIRFLIDGGEKLGYMQPIGRDGSSSFSHIIPELAKDAHSHGNRLRIIGLTKESLCEFNNDDFALYSDQNFEDYIYLRGALCSLSGKRLQPKRNHVNQFLKRYVNYRYCDLTPELFDECLALDCKWRAAHGDICDDLNPEREAMLRAFDHFEELGFRGGALYVDDQMVAFTYGSPINSDTFCTHIEKGDTDITGCYTIINRLFAESLPENFRYINREEDLGIEGLRRAKLSYYPEHKLEKYTAIYLHHDEKECKKLWREVFGDDERFIDEFLINHYSQHLMLRVTDPDNRYLSMVHIIPFESEIGRIAYIYGVATHSECRGRGYASKLMTATMDLIKERGYAAAMLIPSEEWLIGYYYRFGFRGSIPTTFSAYNSFDFGSGDISKDDAMIYPITDIDISQISTLHLSK